MAFYGNLLGGVDSRLDFDPTADPTKKDPWKDLVLTFKAAPKKHLGLAMSRTSQSEYKGDTRVDSEKTAAKLSIDHGDCKTTYGFANDKMTFEGVGKALDSDGWVAKVGASGEAKQAKDEWKVTGWTDVSSPDLGGIKAALNALVEHNNKGVTTLKPKINLEVSDEVNLGASVEHDTKEMKKIWSQAVYRPKGEQSSYWLRADLIQNVVSAGCDQVIKDYIRHSFEAVYGWKDFKGIRDQPVALRAGVEYDLSDQTSVKAAGKWGADYEISHEVEHKIDSHWTVSASQAFDSGDLGSAGGPYRVGFAATYKL